MRDQVRAALFSILGESVVNARFLDLFAGTGSVGIEALSRGAGHVTFIDQSPEAIAIIESNIAELDAEDSTSIIHENVFHWLKYSIERNNSFDLVFIGPPYNHDLANATLKELVKCDILSAGVIVFAEIFKKESLETQYDRLEQIDERTYGDNKIHFYKWGEIS